MFPLKVINVILSYHHNSMENLKIIKVPHKFIIKKYKLEIQMYIQLIKYLNGREK